MEAVMRDKKDWDRMFFVFSFVWCILALLAPVLTSADAGSDRTCKKNIVETRGGVPILRGSIGHDGQEFIVVARGGDFDEGHVGRGARSYPGLLREDLNSRLHATHIRFFELGYQGMESLGALFHLDELLRRWPAALVLEVGVNDADMDGELHVRALESLIHSSRERGFRSRREPRGRPAHEAADLVFFYPFTSAYLDPTARTAIDEAIARCERVAEHYNLPSANAAAAIAEAIARGELTADEVVGADGRLTPEGERRHFEVLKSLFDPSDLGAGERAGGVQPLPEPLSADLFRKVGHHSYEAAELGEGWLDWQKSPTPRFFHVARCDHPGAEMTLRFRGAAVGVLVIATPASGTIEFRLNDGSWRPARFTREVGANQFAIHTAWVADGLDPGTTHELACRLAPTAAPEQSATVAGFLVDGSVIREDPFKGMSTLERLDAIYATMPSLEFRPPPDRWKYLPITMNKLREGGELRIVTLGDSIVNDMRHSDFEYLMMRDYPKCKVKIFNSVRGSTGCWYYREEGRVREYITDDRPDLLIIGGISHRGDVEAIRDVIRQTRAELPNVEILVLTGPFGRDVNPLDDKTWSGHDREFNTALRSMAEEKRVEFFDLAGAWGDYIRETAGVLEPFKRDPVHGNIRGQQLLGRIMREYFAPSGRGTYTPGINPAAPESTADGEVR